MIAPSEYTDEELALQVAGGDTNAFAVIYDRYANLVNALSYSLLGVDQADEAMQEIFLRLWRRGRQYQPDRGSYRSWLISVARNHLLDLLRRRTLRQRLQSLDNVETILSKQAPDDVYGETWQRQRASALRRALSQIPEEQRRVLVLAYFGGLSQSRIAAVLNTPLGTVKKRVRLGMQKLRASLEMQALFQEEAISAAERKQL
jgi:RNA polymerase sigma-70 factor (ECF subfamily)